MPRSWASYEAHTKPLLREDDRRAMLFAFDRWSQDDLTKHADAILGQLEVRTMPYDGAGPADRADFFRRWLAQGAPRLGSRRVAKNAKKEDMN